MVQSPNQTVLKGMSKVARRSKVGNHTRRTLNPWLSPGTSAGTFACPAGPCRNCKGEAGTINEPFRYFVPDPKKSIRKSIFMFRTHYLLELGFEGIRSPWKNLSESSRNIHGLYPVYNPNYIR